MKRFFLTLLFLGTLGVAWTHEYRLQPFKLTAVSYNDRLEMDLDTIAMIWWNQILGEMPPGKWPAELETKALRYIEEHWRIEVDGKVLPPLLKEARYGERVYDTTAGYVSLRWLYDLPEGWTTLKAASRFYEEYLQMEKDEGHKNSFSFEWKVQGRGERTFSFQHPGQSHMLSFDQLHRSRLSLAKEGLRRFFSWSQTAGIFWLGLLAFVLSLRTTQPVPLLAAALLGAGLILFSNLNAPESTRGAASATALLSVMSLRRFPGVVSALAAALWAGTTAWLINETLTFWLGGSSAYPWVKTGFVVGASLVALVFILVGKAIGLLVAKRLRDASPATAEAQIIHYRRIMAALVGIIAIYGGITG